ncbi:hypothetical protein D3C84_817500 [compost metagenome]
MQPQTMPRGALGQMRDVQPDAQFALAQMKTLPGAIGERPGAVELQDDFITGLRNHLPRLLPGAAVNRQGIGEAVWLEREPAVRAIETTVGNAVGPWHQRKTAELAR